MFLSENIIGTARVTLDTKNRFVIPTFTGVSFEDELILYRESNYLSIYEKEYWLKMCGLNYQNDLYNQKDSFDYTFFDVLRSVRVDKKNRICLPQFVVDYYDLNCYCNNRKISSHIFVKGAWDHINVFKDNVKSKKLIRN